MYTLDSSDDSNDYCVRKSNDPDEILVLKTKSDFTKQSNQWHDFTKDNLQLQSILNKYLPSSNESESSCVDKSTFTKNYQPTNLNFNNEDIPTSFHSAKSPNSDEDKPPQASILKQNKKDEPIELSSDDDDKIIPNFSQQTITNDAPNVCQPIRRKLDDSSDELPKKKITKRAPKETEANKLLKKALAAAEKNLKPEECIKFLEVILDESLMSEKFCSKALESLEEAYVQYIFQQQPAPHTVTWKRKVETPIIEDNKVDSLSTFEEIEHVLAILNWPKIVELVCRDALVQHVESLKSIFCNKKLSLVLYGLGDYFKYQKSKIRKEVENSFQNETGETSSKKKTKLPYEQAPIIDKQTLKFALTELQVMCGCSHKMVNNEQDLATTLFQYTKSIAQIPYKHEKNEKMAKSKWYMMDDNKDCVHVDKNGNGLKRFWRQTITSFPMARLELAEAVTSKYTTPKKLFEEYSKCTKSEGERLLQDVPIRRAAGPLTNARKIGPEFSAKMYKFFNSTDKDVVI